MQSPHRQVTTAPGDAILVEFQGRAHVMLFDWTQYQRYLGGVHYRAAINVQQEAPVYLHPPAAGDWYVVVELPLSIVRLTAGPREEAHGYRAAGNLR